MNSGRTIYIVDDDPDVGSSLEMLLRRSGYRSETFESALAFLAAGIKVHDACVLADVRMPEMDGLALQREINRTMAGLPVIIMTGHGDVQMAVQTMKEGAIDFLEKPFEKTALLAAIERAFARQKTATAGQIEGDRRLRRVLTERERDVFELLVEGHQNKAIAYKLGISTRTVEAHRARIMDKLEARSLADLVKYSMASRTK